MIPANPMTRLGWADDDQSAQLRQFAERFAAERRVMRLRTAFFGVVFLIALVGSAVVSEFNPAQLASGLPDAWNYVWSTFPSLHIATMGSDLHEWYWNLPRLLELLAETVLMSFVATVLGSIAALLLCFSASRNLVRGRLAYFLTCRILELARTVPDLVYAMIFVFALGIGPLPGVLALAVHTTGALGKLFSEVNEGIDRRPLDGVTAAGGTWPVIMRMAVLPQVLPNFISYALLRFEFNIRSASVLGVVGAGGIGEEAVPIHPPVRLHRYQRHRAADHPGGDGRRPHLRIHPPPPDRQGPVRRTLGMSASHTAAEAHEIAQWRTSHPELFIRPPAIRWRNRAITFLFVAVTTFGLWWIDASPVRLWHGLSRLGFLLRLMIPPATGGAFGLYAYALFQTLAMAFLGTVLAAVLAFPLGFLAARTIVPNRLLPFRPAPRAGCDLRN